MDIWAMLRLLAWALYRPLPPSPPPLSLTLANSFFPRYTFLPDVICVNGEGGGDGDDVVFILEGWVADSCAPFRQHV